MRSVVKTIVGRSRLGRPTPLPASPAIASGRRRVGWIGAIGLVALGILALNPVLGQRIAQTSFDLIFRLRPEGLLPVPDDLIVVRMDDESRHALAQRRDAAWDRDLHARLIHNLAIANSRAVIVDLFFAEEAPGDTQLANALARHGRVVVSANIARRELPGLGAVEVREATIPALATNAAAVGLLNVVVGDDGVARRLLPGLKGGTEIGWEPALSWVAAELEGRNLAKERGAPVSDLWLNYYGPAGSLPSISYEDALKPESVSRLRNRLVVIGANFEVDFPGARKDTFPTPFGAGRQEMPGLELHATALLNLTRGEWLQRPSPGLEARLIIAFGILLGLGLPRLRPIPAFLACLGAAVGLALLSLFAAWHFQIWWAWLIPAAIQIPAGLLWAWGAHLLLLGHEKDLFRRSLATYLPPRVVEELAARPESLRLGGTVRRVVILFTDITDFSRISQRTDPHQLVALLNDYYDIAIGCVHQSDGTVLGILGDGLFAVWNAPVEQTDPEQRALQAALALTERLRVFEQRSGAPAVRTRIGLHSGVACVGNFGSADHFAYTAIGDAVNLASRLNGLNKHLGTEILVSQDFRQGLHAHQVRPLGHFRFKGFDQAVEVFQPQGLETPAAPDDSRQNEDPCDRAIRLLGEGRLGEAIQAFQASVTACPSDGIARFYLERLIVMPDRGGTGQPIVMELDSK
jgi:adenylate cyclase